ncbi:MAG: WxL domain-containing protein [Lactobacillales bacterium]|jgi:hypothetical protein|nr:WxL domain-containing protein [Lactobacillales bacterium]
MKKNKLSAVILSGVLFSSILPVATNAEQAASNAETKAIVGFSEDESAVNPINPNNPNETLDPADPGYFPDNEITGNEGTLTLDVVPRLLDFGTHLFSWEKAEYAATIKNKESEGLHFLQVTDRRELSNGWALSASLSEFHEAAKGVGRLKGVSIQLPKGEVRNLYYGASAENVPDTSKNLENILNDPTSVFSHEGMELFAGEEAKNILATNKNLKNREEAKNTYELGSGTTTVVWNTTDAKLKVPAKSASVGKYSAKINWTLTAPVTE